MIDWIWSGFIGFLIDQTAGSRSMHGIWPMPNEADMGYIIDEGNTYIINVGRQQGQLKIAESQQLQKPKAKPNSCRPNIFIEL